MNKNNIKIVLILLFNLVLLKAEIDMEQGIYGAAEEMMAFDEKMNKLIAEHNGVAYVKESSPIEDFLETETSYVLEQNIEENNNTQIELDVKNGMLSIAVTIREIEEIKTANEISQEVTMSKSTRSLYIPHNADEKSMVEKYENGILKVIFLKKEAHND